MAVTLHPPTNPQRYRITRSWKGKAFQRYVPFGKDPEKARKKAEELDAALAERQRAYQLRRELEGLHVLRSDGAIIGLKYYVRERPDRKSAQAVFNFRYATGGKSYFKDFVITEARGFDGAFEMAVEHVANHHGVTRDSWLYARMLATKPFYEAKRDGSMTDTFKEEDDHDELFSILAQEVAAFEQRQNNRVIRGSA